MPQADEGVLSDWMIRSLHRTGGIVAPDFAEGQLQPASLDLRLGARAWRIRASFLPGPTRTVQERLGDFLLHAIDLSKEAILEAGCVYVVELQEALHLPADVAGTANPKSSTGRLDVFTRVIADGARGFDGVPAGYRGPLYAEICPNTFSVLVRAGSRLSQMRFRRGSAVLGADELIRLHGADPLTDADNAVGPGGLLLQVDLAGFDGLVGYRAKRHAGLIDIDSRNRYPRSEFWEPIMARSDRTLVLDPDEFYILASKNTVRVPPDHAAEMLPFDASVGEFRAHYAGFFDPGFGHAAGDGDGSRAVLEVRASSIPFAIEDGQVVGRLAYERMLERPTKLYGADLKSHYQKQSLALGRVFAQG